MKWLRSPLVTVFLLFSYIVWSAWLIRDKDLKIAQLKAELVQANNEQIALFKAAKTSIDDVNRECEVQMERLVKSAERGER